jgi:hypothetical protein
VRGDQECNRRHERGSHDLPWLLVGLVMPSPTDEIAVADQRRRNDERIRARLRATRYVARVHEPWQTILTLVAGVGTGVLSAMFGVGGAVVSTPAIRVLGATAFEAVGTTLPSILPSAITGTLRYHREGLIRRDIVGWTGGAGMVASVAGSRLSRSVPGEGHLLMIATAALMLFTAAQTVDPSAVASTVTRTRTRPAALVVTGIVAGGLSGLLGLGGGIVMVPAFADFLHLSIKQAVGTSLACVGLIAVPGIITHAIQHDINWTFAVALSIGVVPGARWGSRLAMRATDRGLRMTVAGGLAVISLTYAIGELVALNN